MRRGLKFRQSKSAPTVTTLSRDLDWVLDQWNSASPEVRLQLVLAKIRHEEKESKDSGRRAV